LYRVDSKKRKKEKERKEGKNKRKKGEPDALKAWIFSCRAGSGFGSSKI